MFLRTVTAGQRRRQSTTGMENVRRTSGLTAVNTAERRKSLVFGMNNNKNDHGRQSTIEGPYLRSDLIFNIPEALVTDRSGGKHAGNFSGGLNLLAGSSARCFGLYSNINTPVRKYRFEKKVSFRVRGHTFETFESTLQRFPDTLLGDKTNLEKYLDQKTNSYVINRCFHSFGAVLFYYQSTGILSRPSDIGREEFINELEFYQIDDHIDARHQQEKKFIKEHEEKSKLVPAGKNRQFIWRILEYKERTYFSKCCFYFYMATSILAIIIFCAETEPGFKSETFWSPLETAVNVLFTIEYILRLYSAPCARDFMFSAFGLVDLFAIVPFYCNGVLQLAGNKAVTSLSILTLLRVLRVFKLTRCNEGLQILMMTIYESFSHLRSLLVCIGITSLFFATVLFYIESEQLGISPTDNFKSIPDSFWYTVITATAVGYGDMYPKTVLGKFVGSVLASVGLLLFCLPTPMLVNKFVECYYIRMILSNKIDPHRKAVINRMRETFMNQ